LPVPKFFTDPSGRWPSLPAYVFITGRRQDELDAAVSQLGENVTDIQGDIAKISDIEKLYAVVKLKKGAIDILFANAGIGEFAPLGQITEQHLDKQFNVNVRGTLFAVQNALPLLRDGGSIVLNASIVSINGNCLSMAAVRSSN
jgi:NAD(P)-dependent dehydrogenase (short-subunit alcohol dehydrogenase family)